ncbi:MAG: VOC family protein [Actinomycetes bacterium]
MTLSLATTFVTVLDFDQAITFYRDALGLQLQFEVGQGDQRWVTLVAPDSPGVSIVLNPTHPGREADGDAVAALVAKGSLNGLIFRTDDVDTMFEKVAATGAEVLQEPMDTHYGVRDCAFRDPSGNLVRIQGAPKGAPADA